MKKLKDMTVDELEKIPTLTVDDIKNDLFAISINSAVYDELIRRAKLLEKLCKRRCKLDSPEANKAAVIKILDSYMEAYEEKKTSQ